MRRTVYFILLFLFSSFFSIAHAQSPIPTAGNTVSISEIFACKNPEWIELFNTADTNPDFSKWKIEKASKATTSWNGLRPLDSSNVEVSGKFLKINLSSFLTDSGFAFRIVDYSDPQNPSIVEMFPNDFDKNDESTFEVCPNDGDTKSWIKQGNTWTLTTTLTPNAVNIHTVPSTPTPSPSLSPTPTPSPTASSTSTPTPTPTSSPTPAPAAQPTTVSLSEFYACQADGTKEWIELYNSGTSAVTLTNWKLADDDNNDQPIASLTIQSKGYAVVEITKYARGMLTNDGDVVNLIDATGKKVESYEYKTCHTDQSWAKINTVWKETTMMTRGTVNQGSDASTPTPTATASAEPESTPEDGSVLGTAVDEPEETPIPSETAKTGNGQGWIAIGSILVGLLVLAGIGGYFGWEWWKKKKHIISSSRAQTV